MPQQSIRFDHTQLLATTTPVFLCVGAASLLIVNLWKPSPKIRGCWLFSLLQDKDSFSLSLRLFDRACPDDYTYCTTSTKLRSFPRSNIFPRSNMRNKNARDARQKTRAASMYKQVKAKKHNKSKQTKKKPFCTLCSLWNQDRLVLHTNVTTSRINQETKEQMVRVREDHAIGFFLEEIAKFLYFRWDRLPLLPRSFTASCS